MIGLRLVVNLLRLGAFPATDLGAASRRKDRQGGLLAGVIVGKITQ